MTTTTLRGVGIGYRRELAHALLSRPETVDFVEVVAEACREPLPRREATALAEVWPVVPHGVKLSLGSADGIDEGRARDFGRLARELRAPVVSEHVSFVRAGGREIGHLTELPMTRDALAVLTRNVTRLRRALPDVPLLLENVARAFVWPDTDHEMGEGAFHAAVAEATGCDLLLDLGNLYANAVNANLDPFAVLATYPLDRVAMLHVAGGVVEHGFYFDTHAHAVPDPVFALVEHVLSRSGPLPMLLERDANYDAHAAILAETARLREMSEGLPASSKVQNRTVEGESDRRSRFSCSSPAASSKHSKELALAQTRVAEALTQHDAPDASPAITRARAVLQRKRADDALPLLPELSARIAPYEALTLGRITEVPRLAAMNAVADAMRIADAACEVPALARSARCDSALLRARFESTPQGPRPRSMPYVSREAFGDGHAVWVLKGFGTGAPVRVISTGARR